VSRLLHATMRRAVRKGGPEQTIRTIARAYLAFARTHPNLYELLLLPCNTEGQEADHHSALWSFVAENVASITGPDKVEEASIALWAFLHGMAELEAIHVFGVGKPGASFDFGLDAWIAAASSSRMEKK
jgi:hypothetical protein